MSNIETPSSLDHITDVGVSDHNGVDSSLRIRTQYRNLGVACPNIIPAGHSPLHVAFAASTTPSPQAAENAQKILARLGINPPSNQLPVALNSAPRNSAETLENGQEDYIYRVKSDEES